MDDVRRIGLRQVPDDADIALFLNRMWEEHQEKLEAKEFELDETLESTIKEKEPPIFAFGKLMNYLATLEKPELIELLSASMWRRCWPH